MAGRRLRQRVETDKKLGNQAVRKNSSKHPTYRRSTSFMFDASFPVKVTMSSLDLR